MCMNHEKGDKDNKDWRQVLQDRDAARGQKANCQNIKYFQYLIQKMKLKNKYFALQHNAENALEGKLSIALCKKLICTAMQ